MTADEEYGFFESEDEFEVPESHAKRQKSEVSQFFEIEAMENERGEDEDDSDLAFDNDIVDDGSIEDNEVYLAAKREADARIKRRSGFLDDFRLKLGELEERYAFEEDFENQTPAADDAIELSAQQKVNDFELNAADEAFHITDLMLWHVKLPIPGTEKEVVYNIWKKFSTMNEESRMNCGVYATYMSAKVRGCIYIEAVSQEAVREFMSDIPLLILNTIHAVPNAEAFEVLNIDQKTVEIPKLGNWCRVKKGLYAGTIGLVSFVNQAKFTVGLRIIPQLSLETIAIDLKNKRRSLPFHKQVEPHCVLTNDLNEAELPYTFIRSYTNALKVGDFVFEEQTGFLLKNFRAASLKKELPTAQELALFKNAENDLSALVGEPVEMESAKQYFFSRGQVVRVLDGELKGLTGTVLSDVVGGFVTIMLQNQKSCKIEPEMLHKIFGLGDTVIVMDGEHIKHSGLVLNVSETEISVLDSETHKCLNVKIEDAVLQNELVGAATAKRLEGITIGDLIIVDADQSVGVIIWLYPTGTATVLQSSQVINVPIKSVSKMRNSSHYAGVDVDNNKLTPGCKVSVVEGEFARSQCDLLFIWKDTAFLVCDSAVETNGYAAVETSLLRLIDACPNLNSRDTPHQMGLLRQKKIMGERVLLISGQHKGLHGQVRSIDDNTASILVPAEGREVRVPISSVRVLNQNSEASRFIRRKVNRIKYN